MFMIYVDTQYHIPNSSGCSGYSHGVTSQKTTTRFFVAIEDLESRMKELDLHFKTKNTL
jgi:hypothetical protein